MTSTPPTQDSALITPGRIPARPLGATPRMLTQEYVAGGNLGWFYGGNTNYGRALPSPIDDVEQDFGDDIYLKMSIDTQVAACTTIFRAGILEGGLELTSPIEDAADSDYDLAATITDEATAMLDNLRTPLDDVLWDMLSSLSLGSKVAELIFELGSGAVESRKLLQLVAMKPKPRHATAFVLDAYSNVYGLLIRLPGQASSMTSLAAFDPQNPPVNFLPREKFAINTFRPVDGDPRGSSLLRPAYDPWWRKRQIYQEHLRYIAQFAGPSIVGFTPPDAQTQPATDDLGNILPGVAPITPEQAMLAALQQLRNGTAAAFPGGSSITPINMSGDGAAFLRAIAECNVSITKALLTQSLATEEGEHQTRAASTVHQDVLGTLVRQGKRGLIRMFTRDILRPWVIYNWGEQAAKSLVPVCTLGETEQQDVAPMITALASAGYQVGPSQLVAIDGMLNLPVRDPDADAAEADLLAQQAADVAQASKPVPAPQGPAGGVTSTPAAGDSGASPPSAPPSPTPSKTAHTGPSGTSTVQAPIPAGRIAVRGHTRAARAAAAKMSNGGITPRGKPLAKTPASVKYTAADLRALARAWDAAVPDEAGLLKATVQRVG